jgi:selenocysteine-specific elongation factor
VFAAKGAGTVVTGTLTGGPIELDEELHAGRHSVRVRGLETAGRRSARAEPGARVALNLAGVDHTQLRRGDAVLRPDQWALTSVVDVAVTTLAGETGTRRRLHAAVGSGEHRVAFRALDDDGRYARLRFESPLPLVPGDRVVLRDTGRGATVAGAEVLDIHPTRRAADAPNRLRLPLGERLLAAAPWCTTIELGRDGGLGATEAADLAAQLVGAGTAVRVGPWVVDAAALGALRLAARTRVAEHHRLRPRDPGVEVTRLAETLPVRGAQLRAALEDDPDLVVERGVVRHATHARQIAGTPEARDLVATLAATPFGPPSPADLGVDPDLVRALVREGALVDLDGVVFTAEALEVARRAVVGALATRQHLSVAEVRDTLGSTRKYVLPICGWLDRQGITRRRGDDRIAGPTSGLLP